MSKANGEYPPVSCSVCHGDCLVREQKPVEVKSLFSGDTLTIHGLPVRCPHCGGAGKEPTQNKTFTGVSSASEETYSGRTGSQ